MAKYYLLNAVTVRATQMWPGSEINDLCDDVASITSAGGKFIAVTEPGAAAASALAMNLKKNGGAIADAAAAMQIAYSASEGADFSVVLSAAIGQEVSDRNTAIGAIADATAANKGLATATQISKLDGIAPGATANTLAIGTTTGTAGDGRVLNTAVGKLAGIAANATNNTLTVGTTTGTAADGGVVTAMKVKTDSTFYFKQSANFPNNSTLDAPVLYTVPAATMALLEWCLVHLDKAPVGAGTAVLEVGTTVGGVDILLATAAISSATPLGVITGWTLLSLGTTMAAASGFSAMLAAAATLNLRIVSTGSITDGTVSCYGWGKVLA